MITKMTNEGIYSSPEVRVIQVLAQTIVCGSPSASLDDPESGGDVEGD